MAAGSEIRLSLWLHPHYYHHGNSFLTSPRLLPHLNIQDLQNGDQIKKKRGWAMAKKQPVWCP